MAWTVRYVSVAGAGAHDGTSEANAWTLAEAIAAPYASGMQLNVKAGTYANTTTGRTFGVAGTTTAPIWWRGYKTTIGDLDDGITLARSLQDGVNLPLITFTTGQVVISGAHQIFSNLDITSQCVTASGAVSVTGGLLSLILCRIENTAANTEARAISMSTVTGNRIVGCRFKVTSTASFCVVNETRSFIFGCHIIGGVNALYLADHAYIIGNVIQSFTEGGIKASGATAIFTIAQNTIYAAATNDIEFNVTLTSGSALVVNNILGGCTNGIKSAAGSNGITQYSNHFYSCTNNLVNITELAAVGDNLGVLFRLIDNDTDPFVAKASSDFTLATAAIDKSAGFPGIFEGQTVMVGYSDIGAVRHVDPAAGGRPEFRGSNL